MSRVISTGDLHNVVTKRKMEYGKLATLVDNIVEEMVEEIPTANVISIPEGATNGDMIKAMFPNVEVKPHITYGIKCGVEVIMYINEHSVFELWFPTDWWNAPYKKVRDKE